MTRGSLQGDRDAEIPKRQRPLNSTPNNTTYALVGRLFCSGRLSAPRLRDIAQIGRFVRFGVSSAAMVEAAVRDEPVPSMDRPSDWDDLERCEIVHAIGPVWLADMTTHILIDFRREVVARADRWNLQPKPDHFTSWRLPWEEA
ncbi:MAG: hypothetical protein ACH36H_13050 [Candidatus Nanopelagicales bacterium]